jgi:hypothetical protein
MVKWILIIALQWHYTGTAITHIEFDDRPACEFAREMFTKAAQKNAALVTTCVPKSTEKN